MRYRSKTSNAFGPDCLTKAFPVSCASRIEKPIAYYPGDKWCGEHKWIADTVTPHYFKMKREKSNLPFNPLAITTSKGEILGSTSFRVTTVADVCTSPSIKGWYQNEGAFLCANVWPFKPNHLAQIDPDNLGRLITEVVTRGRASRQAGKTNYIESLAELDKTFEMIRHPFENVISFVREFKRTGKRRSRRINGTRIDRDGGRETFQHTGDDAAVQFVASEWLRFRYGINPLVNDVREGMKALRRNYKIEPRIHTARAAGQDEANAFTSGSFTGGEGAYRVSWQQTGRHFVSVRVMFRDVYGSTPWTDLGFTFQNVVGVAWELTRLSFVVDWFVNVSDLIYANVPRVGLVAAGGALTIKNENTTVLSPTGLTSLTPSSQTVSGSVGDVTKITDTRLTRNYGTDVPDQVNSGLVIKSDFRLDRWVRTTDAAALIVKLLRSVSFG